jgi:hypothetical protein
VTGDKNKVSTYFSQIDAGYKTLVELSERWDEYIAAGDGDVVRRRLGTVGDKSPVIYIVYVCIYVYMYIHILYRHIHSMYIYM